MTMSVAVGREDVTREASDAAVSPLSGCHALIADDSVLNRRALRRLLQRLGCTCEEAQNGAEAVSATARRPFDLIVMDAEMPILDGFQAARIIRAAEVCDGRRTPMLALTGMGFEADRSRCYAVGMDAFLVKPVRLAELRDALERILEAVAA